MPTQVFLFLIMSVFAFSTSLSAQEIIFLDPGHTLEAPGEIGSCGTQEVWVNDQVTLKLARLLQAGGYKVQFSRLPNTDRSKVGKTSGREPMASLKLRGEKANASKAKLFVSVHHDSVKDEALVRQSDACPGFTPSESLVIGPDFLRTYQVGFNVFIHNTPGEKFDRSLRFARLIGQGFVEQKEIPSNFHTVEVEPDCTSCKVHDANLGVIGRNLAVIRTPKMPAVLVEITNLRNPELERKSNNPAYQDLIAKTLKQAIDEYFGKEVKDVR